MIDWIKKFFESETGKPSRSGTAGLWLVLVFSVAWLYCIFSGNTGPIEKIGGLITTLILGLLVGAKAADAYTAAKKIVSATGSTVKGEDKKDPPPKQDPPK